MNCLSWKKFRTQDHSELYLIISLFQFSFLLGCLTLTLVLKRWKTPGSDLKDTCVSVRALIDGGADKRSRRIAKIPHYAENPSMFDAGRTNSSNFFKMRERRWKKDVWLKIIFYTRDSSYLAGAPTRLAARDNSSDMECWASLLLRDSAGSAGEAWKNYFKNYFEW